MTHLTTEQLETYVMEPGADRHDVELHLAECAACRDRLQREASLELELAAVARVACLECARPVTDEHCDYCGAARTLPGFELEAIKVHHARGRLYVARDERGQRVAIKELVFAHAPGIDALDAFEREARILRSLAHARIPRFIASFTRGEGVRTRMYLVQEFVAGESLLERLQHHHFTEDELVAIARDVLRTLVYLQALTPMVFHRDVKPANLVQRDDGGFALVDFGAARDLGATFSATVVGTFGYMPAEQLAGVVDATTDLFALGTSLYHLATRTEPWQLDDRVKARAHVSSRFRRVLDRLTERDPARRFPDAIAALGALDAPARSDRRMIAAACAVAATFGTGLGYAAWKLSHRGGEPAASHADFAPVAAVPPSTRYEAAPAQTIDCSDDEQMMPDSVLLTTGRQRADLPVDVYLHVRETGAGMAWELRLPDFRKSGVLDEKHAELFRQSLEPRHVGPMTPCREQCGGGGSVYEVHTRLGRIEKRCWINSNMMGWASDLYGPFRELLGDEFADIEAELRFTGKHRTGPDSSAARAARAAKLQRALLAESAKLVASEPADVRDAVESARDILTRPTGPDDNWTRYSPAFGTLRTHRTKAAVPLVIAAMQSHWQNEHIFRRQATELIASLVGLDPRDLDPLDIAERWWPENRDRLRLVPLPPEPPKGLKCKLDEVPHDYDRPRSCPGIAQNRCGGRLDGVVR